jgi:hypothetical protein
MWRSLTCVSERGAAKSGQIERRRVEAAEVRAPDELRRPNREFTARRGDLGAHKQTRKGGGSVRLGHAMAQGRHADAEERRT